MAEEASSVATGFTEAERRIQAWTGGPLDLSNLGLDMVPDSIGQLTSLTELRLDGNQLTTVPDSIGQLTSLTYLSLRDNQLTTVPDSIGQLTSLTYLSLRGNQLTTVPDSIGQLTSLTQLFLHGNQLTTEPDSIGQLTSLTQLWLYDNQLTTVPDSIGQLTSLTELYLHGNQLTTVPDSIGQLTSLTTLSLQDNPATQGVPSSVLNGRPEDLIRFVLDLRQASRPLNEIKLLVLGRGGAGKSSIKDRLLHDRFDPKRAETPGVDIERWPLTLDVTQVQVNVWDFAGQEIAHATHRFFLTERSVYMVVLDARSDTQDADAEYWCRTASAFGKQSPIIVVLNKQKEKPFDIDRHRLKDRYPTIACFVETDCADRTGLDDLAQQLGNVIRNHPALEDQLPEAWHQLKTHFANVDDLPNYQTLSEFKETCKQLGEPDDSRQATLARILHALGLIIHYGDDRRLRDTAVLNPEWVTSGVYRLLRAKEGPDSDGTLTFAEAQAVLGEEQPAQVRYLLNLMRRFELCFPLDQEQLWLVPELLPKYQPELDPTWRTAQEAVRLRFAYEFLPEGLLAQFITRMHPLGEDQQRWRTGAVLVMEEAKALVQADPGRGRVDITVLGDAEGQRRLTGLIRTQFAHLHEQLDGLDVELSLELSDRQGVFANVSALESDEASGTQSATPTKSGTVPVDQSSELNRISLPEARSGERRPLNAFLSYSHDDMNMRDRLLVNLEVLKSDRYLSTWTDAQILPSDRWDDEIRAELEQADIIIFLVSSNMLASPYIRGVELKRALERRQAEEAEIVLVILEDCSWKGRDFAQYQVVLGDKPVARHGRYSDAFNTVEDELRRLIDDLVGDAGTEEDVGPDEHDKQLRIRGEDSTITVKPKSKPEPEPSTVVVRHEGTIQHAVPAVDVKHGGSVQQIEPQKSPTAKLVGGIVALIVVVAGLAEILGGIDLIESRFGPDPASPSQVEESGE